jgi:putative ABC transport system permease protein
MSYTRLVWVALWRRPARTLLTLLSVVAAFVIFGALQGINVGFRSVADAANLTVLRVSSRLNRGAPLPVSYVSRVAEVPGVVRATGTTVLVGTYRSPRDVIPIVATDIEAIFSIYPQLTAPAEQLRAAQRTRTGVLVGRKLALQEGWKIGDRIPIHSQNVAKSDGSLDWTFDIAGIYDFDQPDLAIFVLAQYDYINTARQKDRNTVTQVVARVDSAEHAARVSQNIDDLFANSPNRTLTQTEKDFLQSLVRQIGNIDLVVNGVVGAVLFTLLFLTANTLAQSVRERAPELAVLKAIGFTDAGLQGLVLTESLVICCVAAAIGLAVASRVLPRITQDMPNLGVGAMHMTSGVLGGGMLIAVLIALAAGVPLARKARRIDVAATLARS